MSPPGGQLLPLEAAQSPHHLWQALTELVFIKPQTLLFIGQTHTNSMSSVVPSRLVAGDIAPVYLVFSATGWSSGTPEAEGLPCQPHCEPSSLSERGGAQGLLAQYYILRECTAQGTKNERQMVQASGLIAAAGRGAAGHGAAGRGGTFEHAALLLWTFGFLSIK